MIKLNAQIRVQRLAGKVLLIPSSSAGGPLQAKTAYPSHSEQIIAPDEDFYGLVSVTVKPTPRLPACVVSVAEVVKETVENVVNNIAVGVSVTSGKWYTHFLYNGVRLPRIPDNVLAEYPYAWIRTNTTSGYYDLILTKVTGYYDPAAGTNPGMVYGSGAAGTEAAQYRVGITNASGATSWEYNQTTSTWFGLDSNRTVLWSNHDIPNGSATATDIYFAGSEPVPTD